MWTPHAPELRDTKPKEKYFKIYKNNNISKDTTSNSQRKSISRNRNPKFTGYDRSSIMNLKLLIQQTQLTEYESWTKILLTWINEQSWTNTDTHIDMGTPIQKALERVQNLQDANYKIKEKIISKMKENETLQNDLNVLKTQNAMMRKEVQQDCYLEVNTEKEVLASNIQALANEWDDLSVKHKNWAGKVNVQEMNISPYKTAFEQYLKVKDENKILSKMLELRTKYNIHFETAVQRERHKEIAVSSWGNYTLETEEDFFKSNDTNFFGLFGCSNA